MPTTYAHYRFGCYAYDLMPTEIQDIISNNRQLFDFGVHGPDLLFYYKPTSKNHVNLFGTKEHTRTGYSFFTQAAKTINASSNWGTSLSYALGVLCHFTLDSVCHPYVAEKEMDGVSHSLIEASYDRALMLKDGLVPIDTSTTNHLHPSNTSALIISEFYPPITSKEVLFAEKSMIFWLNRLNMKSGNPRIVVENILKTLNLNSFHDLLMPTENVQSCVDSDERLIGLFSIALKQIPDMVNEFLLLLEKGNGLGEYYNHTFGVE